MTMHIIHPNKDSHLNHKPQSQTCQLQEWFNSLLSFLAFSQFISSLTLLSLSLIFSFSLCVSTLGNLCSHSLTLSPWNGWVSHGSSLTRENSAGQKWLRWHRCSSSVRGSTSLLFSCKSEASWDFVVYPPPCDTQSYTIQTGAGALLRHITCESY